MKENSFKKGKLEGPDGLVTSFLSLLYCYLLAVFTATLPNQHSSVQFQGMKGREKWIGEYKDSPFYARRTLDFYFLLFSRFDSTGLFKKEVTIWVGEARVTFFCLCTLLPKQRTQGLVWLYSSALYLFMLFQKFTIKQTNSLLTPPFFWLQQMPSRACMAQHHLRARI